MKAGNHVAGGLVITGFFASLWNINIFANLDTVLFTILASQLPDIDHSKSIIGKCFRPLARWIDRKFGHRTITHSLIFLLGITLVAYLLENVFGANHIYAFILFFSVFSHFLLDMVTVQGIPLFYPFLRNPCVIPGNASMRIRSGNVKAEIAAFAIFILIGFTSMDLFANGFWTSYNRAFGTLKHLTNEYKKSDNLVLCEYSLFNNGNHKTGTAYLLASNDNECILFNRRIIKISKGNPSILIEHVKPIKTTYPKRFEQLGFFNISYDSLQNVLNNKIVSGQIQSSKKIQYLSNNITITSKLIKLDNSYNFELFILPDSLKNNIEQRIALNTIKLNQEQYKYKLKLSELDKLIRKKDSLKSLVCLNTSAYVVDKLKSDIMDLKDLIQRKKYALGTYTPDALIKYEISILEQQKQFNETLFSGLITYPILPDTVFYAQNY